jgi:hypothetical protein
MENVSETARLKVIRQICRARTLDLYLRRGEFWDIVRKHRHRRQAEAHGREVEEWIDQSGGCPDWNEPTSRPQCPGCLQCKPPQLSDDAPRKVPPTLFDQDDLWRSPLGTLSYRGEGGWALEEGVRQLYYRFERDLAGAPSVFRQAFFAGCILCDPPDDDLLGFADHANDWLAPRRAVGDNLSWPYPTAEKALPIEWMPNPHDLEIAAEAQERGFGELKAAAFKDALRAELTRLGIDADAVIRHAERGSRTYLSARLAERAPAQDDASYQSAQAFLDRVWATAVPYIRVDELTNKEDASKAYDFIRSLSPQLDRRTKRMDPLICVQCAIWYDQCGWSHTRIAKRFGWKVQRKPAQRPSSETARRHIADGRSILSTQK